MPSYSTISAFLSCNSTKPTLACIVIWLFALVPGNVRIFFFFCMCFRTYNTKYSNFLHIVSTAFEFFFFAFVVTASCLVNFLFFLGFESFLIITVLKARFHNFFLCAYVLNIDNTKTRLDRISIVQKQAIPCKPGDAIKHYIR